MNLKDGEHVLIADDAETFASAVVRLYKDQTLWEGIVREGRKAVNERWSEERVGAGLLESLFGVERSNVRRNAGQGFPIIEEEEKLSLVATGHDWFQQRFTESARAVFAESVKRYPDLASGYIGLAMCAYAEKKFDDVARLVLLAAERSAESSGVNTWEALTLKSQGKLKPAVTKLRQALSLQSSNALALRTLADLLRKEGRPKEAFECYRQLLQKYPADMEALMKTAEIAIEVGQHESAMNLLQKALRSAQASNDIANVRQIGQSLQKLSSGIHHRNNGKKFSPAKNAASKIDTKEDGLSRIENQLKDSPADQSETMQSGSPRLTSIVILTYNNLDFTRKCIESVERNTRAPHEIIVVDNSSTDGTQRWLQEMQEKERIHVCILNKENVGFPAGVNQAINAAAGEYVLLLNNDTIVTKGWLERLIDVAESDQVIAIVGPMSNLVSGVQMDATAKYKDIGAMHEHAAAVARANRGITMQSPRVAFLCTLIKKKVIDTIGGLDERFTPGNFEDDDFCLRAQLAGFKTVVAKDVFIHHYGSKSFGADGQEAYAARIETNRRVFIEKWDADPIQIWKEGKAFRKRSPLYPLNKDSFVQHFERAKLLIEEKELPLALVSLKTAAAHFHSSERQGYSVTYPDVLNLTGNVALMLNDLDTATECFKKESELTPDSERARAGMENVRNAQVRPSASRESGQAMPSRIDPPTADPTVQQVLSYAVLFSHSGHLPDAVKVLREAISAFPGNATLYSTLAWLFIQHKMFDDASALIESTPDSIKKSIEWLEIAGYCTEGQGFDDVAGQCADKALALAPTSTRALTLKGILAAKTGDDDNARKLFVQAIEQSGDMAAPNLHLGVLLWQNGEREEGCKFLEKAFVLEPTDGETAVTYYRAAETLGKLDEAQKLFRQASEKYPVHKQLRHFVADVLARQGKYAEAMDAIEDAITLFGPDGDILPFAREIRKELGAKEIHRPNGEHETVSLCMIVKNEEQSLARCLSSVKNLVDEMIVVDTGSTDKTKEVAEVFGAKVFEFSWTESFSDARNFSLSKADGDWILVLDGDEVISLSDHEGLKKIIASSRKKKKAYSFTTRNYVEPTDTQGWVRNDGAYREEAGTGWIPSVESEALSPSGLDSIPGRSP